MLEAHETETEAKVDQTMQSMEPLEKCVEIA